ncbi:hypothetical protein C6A37_03990, partial [Desulfobacteraceae bacterium SEEP-SAG9]
PLLPPFYIIFKLFNKKSFHSDVYIFIHGVAGFFLIKVLDTGINFMTQIFLARVMSIEDYGYFVYVVNWITVLVLFCKIGFDTLLLRYVISYSTIKNWGRLKGLLRSGNFIVLVMSLLVSLLTGLIIKSIDYKISITLANTFWIACVILPFTALAQLQKASLQSLKHVVLASLPQRIINPILLILFVIVSCFCVGQPLSSPTVMAYKMAATMVSFFLSLFLLSKHLPEKLKYSICEYENLEWIKVSIPLLFISGMYVVMRQTDILMLGFFLDSKDVGIYSASVRIASLMGFGLVAINSIFAPMISQLYIKKQYTELQNIVTLASRILFGYSLFIAIALILIGKYLLSLFGMVFHSGYTPLNILLIGQFVSSIVGSVGYLMIMTGHQKQASKIVGGCVFINFLLNYTFIPQWGLTGAAIATGFTTALLNIMMYLYVKKKININSMFIRMK